MPGVSSAQQRITRLASLTAVHRAFHWLHLHQPQLRKWQLEMVRIPAPSFGESERAAWFLDRFRQLGLANPHLDKEGNALAELPSMRQDLSAPPVVLLSAHLDTVFPPGTDCEPIEAEEDNRIYAPGICDNAAGLTGLLAIASALRYAGIVPPVPVLFAANVGEEGEGDLRGMRHLFEQGSYRHRIAAAIVLEGGGTSTAVTRALGSVRLRITINGPGGHSWADAGSPNPILILSRILSTIADLPLPGAPLTTLNIGHISGGTSINSIPETATALLDLRSASPEHLAQTDAAVRDVCHQTVAKEKKAKHTCRIVIENIGNRPAATLAEDSSILQTLHAIDRHLSLRTEERLGSTDANIPISLNIPALALGTGGTGGGIHTLQEWYDPTGRETALRRILLTLLDTIHVAAGE
ncbi:MAG TPA: M20/M25/M40 family metallo-hydrolase [Edaphobacter sp.]|nr:M20/M25/M40 family metallo-hydrolase [Edaphobacter sp.]